MFSCSVSCSKRVIKVPKKSLDHTLQPHHCMSCVLRIRIPSRYLQWRWRVMNPRNGFKQKWHRNAMTFLKVMPQCKFADALPTHFVVMESLSWSFYVYKSLFQLHQHNFTYFMYCIDVFFQQISVTKVCTGKVNNERSMTRELWFREKKMCSAERTWTWRVWGKN